jgi:hypothetical protein
LAQADEAFRQSRFAEARLLYEQLQQVDPQVAVVGKDCWAYCKLRYVVERLNDRGKGEPALADLEREVTAALALAPQMADSGKWLLKEIEKRKNGPRAGALPAVAVQHFPRNAQGWQVAETANFRIYHNQPRDFVEKVARQAERTCAEMQSKWFGVPAAPWNPRCEVFLHPTAEEYTRQTGERATSPGHSRIESDASGSRIVSRRIELHCDVPTLLEAELPHETTHVVLAGQFGPRPLPRWADEGMAVLSEPTERIEPYRRNLTRSSQDKQLFGVGELMNLNDYPPARRITVFYAQSISLVEFLSKQRGPVVFTQFLRDGLRDGFEAALRKNYGFQGFNDLQQRWTQQALAGVPAASALAGR